MQREEAGYIVISCDFCGADWDEVIPMIEGHRGSVLCLGCLKRALAEATPADAAFECTMCLREKTPGTKRWTHPEPAETPGLNAAAQVCWPCLKQAGRGFGKDPDTDFDWDPKRYPND